MNDLDDANPAKLGFFTLHQSLGVCVFVLAITRIFVKFRAAHPPLPSDLSMWDRRMAQGTHFFLYLILVLMPLTGILMTVLSGYSVPFFNFFEFPRFLNENQGAGKLLTRAHEFLAYAIATLVVLHLGGILKEFVLHKRNLLKRMI